MEVPVPTAPTTATTLVLVHLSSPVETVKFLFHVLQILVKTKFDQKSRPNEPN